MNVNINMSLSCVAIWAGAGVLEDAVGKPHQIIIIDRSELEVDVERGVKALMKLQP